ncbi:MAG: DNA cytosine methyltransferase [Alistipes sp.]
MKILSLFDGISCGRVALDRAGIKVNRYVAYEIDKYAIQVSEFNYPDIEHCGNVVGADFFKYKGFDLVMGGFPCTDLSLAKANRRGLKGEHSSLFWEIVRAIKEVQPKYFLVENNYGMPPEDYRVICDELGCEPIMINSALVSAQTRKRYYWTNIAEQSYGLFGDKRCGVPQPQDKGLLLKDILLSGNVHNDKSYCLTSTYNGACFSHDYERAQRQLVAEQINGVQSSLPICVGNLYSNGSQGGRIYSELAKSVSLTSNAGGAGAKSGLYAITNDARTDKIYGVRNGKININGKILKINLPNGMYSIRKLHPIECERLQTLPDSYTANGINHKGGYYENQ